MRSRGMCSAMGSSRGLLHTALGTSSLLVTLWASPCYAEGSLPDLSISIGGRRHGENKDNFPTPRMCRAPNFEWYLDSSSARLLRALSLLVLSSAAYGGVRTLPPQC